ncbi:MAG: mechanosensitive ion channel family protein [Phaeodactylibacter sp.]|nr:mechanosensitive ion channel family protein [Phaeodactylibacter sp.]MCB9274261.1 mechanosensitive ion channel family protein [Lewinellaceae bacterium]
MFALIKRFDFLLKLIALGALLYVEVYHLARILGPEYDYFADIVIRYFIFALGLSVVVSTLSWLYRRGKKMKPSQVDNVTLGLQNIYYLLITGGLIMTALGFWKIDFKTLFTTLSIVAAAIAIISKDFIAEIISGIIISFSREISIDDYVKIGDHKGKIIDITLTKIALLNDDDDLIFMPNTTVFSSQIVNYTKREIKKISIEFEVMIQSLKTVEELENDLIRAIAEFKEHIVPNSYTLKIVEIRRDSLSLKFQYTLDHINRDLEREIRRKTVRRVVNYVKKNLNAASRQPQPESPVKA